MISRRYRGTKSQHSVFGFILTSKKHKLSFYIQMLNISIMLYKLSRIQICLNVYVCFFANIFYVYSF